MRSAHELVNQLAETNVEIGALVGSLGSSPTASEFLDVRARIGRLEAEFDDASNALAELLGLTSARQRILAYLMQRVGEVVSKEELAGVSGIFEFPRRVRELRDEGWSISSMDSHPGLRPGQYVLQSLERRRSSVDQVDGSINRSGECT